MIREGDFADLTLFDPETIGDRASFDHPLLNPRGSNTSWSMERSFSSGAGGQRPVRGR